MQSGVVWTAMALAESDVASLEQTFAARLREDVRLTQRVDPSLLGGVRVELAGRVYDGSLKNQLARIRRALAAEEGERDV
ncbi:MAG: F0F1 ATP synthase subunit delta [Clostridiales bacterium]|nr:F0F1 ATP synthase subunit delta [Clostridiales bacterium]